MERNRRIIRGLKSNDFGFLVFIFFLLVCIITLLVLISIRIEVYRLHCLCLFFYLTHVRSCRTKTGVKNFSHYILRCIFIIQPLVALILIFQNSTNFIIQPLIALILIFQNLNNFIIQPLIALILIFQNSNNFIIQPLINSFNSYFSKLRQILSFPRFDT